MTRLWIILAVSLAIAVIIDFRDKNFASAGSKKKDVFFTFLLCVILSFFCGLRTWGNDTGTYRDIYVYLTPDLSGFFAGEMPDFADGIGLSFVNSLLKTFQLTFQDTLIVYAFATIFPYVYFVRRYSVSMVFGVFLMFTTGFYTFTLAAIKQCMATALCLLAVDALLHKKRIRYLLFLVMALLFHPYSIVYLLAPVMMFKPWTKRTFIYMAIFVAIGFLLEELLGVVLDITDMMGADYDESSFVGEGVNIFRVFVAFVPLLLATVGGSKTFEYSTKTDNLMFNLAMLNALLMFVGLFGTANYFARLANYFLPGQIIAIPFLLRRWRPEVRRILVIACIVGYLGYFIYENAIIRPFDYGYSQMNFFDYIDSII
ncbi:MAG: EpsG family protein [Clostridia bacterium]|nr:EpsG family protein [Clostridia bacterium]